MQLTVGFKLKGKAEHVVAGAQDALVAALQVKTECPEAVIMYVRPQDRRGDARHSTSVQMDVGRTARSIWRFFTQQRPTSLAAAISGEY